MKMRTKQGNVSDYNLVCPDCGAIYYEGMRRSTVIIKYELFLHGRVRKGNGPCFVPSCPGCSNSDYYRFTPDDLKPRSRKQFGKVIIVKKGDLGPCYGGYTSVKVDWDLQESNDIEKEKLIKGLSRFKDSRDGVRISARFPEYNTVVSFKMSVSDPMETIEVYGRVSMEDARAFVKDLLEMVNQ
jgi:hypothetical protein